MVSPTQICFVRLAASSGGEAGLKAADLSFHSLEHAMM
jgi:hypothetical protein